jgi:hypothetical protein
VQGLDIIVTEVTPVAVQRCGPLAIGHGYPLCCWPAWWPTLSSSSSVKPAHPTSPPLRTGAVAAAAGRDSTGRDSTGRDSH